MPQRPRPSAHDFATQAEPSAPLVRGRLIRRYKRFLIDLQMSDGKTLTVHCPNTGTMEGCLAPGAEVVALRAANPSRKLAYTAEWIDLPGAGWVGVNTHRSNSIVGEALRARRISSLAAYSEVRGEVAYPQPRRRRKGAAPPHSRADFLLSGPEQPDCYLEVKNATLPLPDGAIAFPDAITERGLRHIAELRRMLRRGHRAVLFFLVNRQDGRYFRPAWERDPRYARALVLAHRAGVEVLARRVVFDLPEVSLGEPVTVELEPRP